MFGRIFSGRADATGVVIDYGFTTPKQAVAALLLDNNGGGVLNDSDGIGTATVQVLDSNGSVLFSGQLVAGNGGSTFRTSFPDALDDVARVRLSNITNLAPAVAAPDIIWRELRAVQLVSTPRIVSTTSAADASADDVVIEGTDDLPGTLSWTLYGPVRAGPNGTCTDATWTGATVYASGSVAIVSDGTVQTAPPAAPTVGGCYWYAHALSGPSYTAPALGAVGQASETVALPRRRV